MARQYRTLGELRAEMRALLGHAAAGSGSAGVNTTLVDTHLRNAQTLLYWAHDWAHLRAYATKQTGASSTLFDYPTNANPDRIKALSVYRGGVWSPPIPKGIPPALYTTQANESWPQRWEPYTQIEVWPQTDADYAVRVFYIANLGAFTDDDDRASIDDTLISIVAIGTLKAHYRQPDAKVHMDASDALLRRLKAKSWGQDVFRPNDYIDSEPLARPQTV